MTYKATTQTVNEKLSMLAQLGCGDYSNGLTLTNVRTKQKTLVETDGNVFYLENFKGTYQISFRELGEYVRLDRIELTSN